MLTGIWIDWDGTVACKFADGHYEDFYDVGLDMLKRITVWLRARQGPGGWTLRPESLGSGIVADLLED